MPDESKGPEGWEAEDFERDRIKELREQGFDPGSAQMKLKSEGHPSARSMGTHTGSDTAGDVEAPTSGPGREDRQAPGGEEEDMILRDGASGGGDRPEGRARREGE